MALYAGKGQDWNLRPHGGGTDRQQRGVMMEVNISRADSVRDESYNQAQIWLVTNERPTRFSVIRAAAPRLPRGHGRSNPTSDLEMEMIVAGSCPTLLSG